MLPSKDTITGTSEDSRLELVHLNEEKVKSTIKHHEDREGGGRLSLNVEMLVLQIALSAASHRTKERTLETQNLLLWC